MESIDTNNVEKKYSLFPFREKHFFRIFFLGKFFKSDSRSKLSSNRQCNRIRLAKLVVNPV